MRKLIIVFSFLCLPVLVSAQDYTTAIGIRGGFYSGLSVKHFVSSDAALEGILSTRWHGYQLTGLYELHWPVNTDLGGLYWIFGGGAHMGTYGSGWYLDRKGNPYQRSVTSIGVDLIFGMEYVFEEAPITLGLDVRPFFEFVNPSQDFMDLALTARFYLN